MHIEAPDSARKLSNAGPNGYIATMMLVLKNNAMKIIVTIASIGFATLSAYLINNQQIQVLKAQLDAAQSQIQLLQNLLGTAQTQITLLQTQLVSDQATATVLHADLQKLNATLVSLNIAPLIATGSALVNQIQTATAQFSQQTAQFAAFNHTVTAQFLSQSQAAQAQISSASTSALSSISAQRVSSSSSLSALNRTISLALLAASRSTLSQLYQTNASSVASVIALRASSISAVTAQRDASLSSLGAVNNTVTLGLLSRLRSFEMQGAAMVTHISELNVSSVATITAQRSAAVSSFSSLNTSVWQQLLSYTRTFEARESSLFTRLNQFNTSSQSAHL